MPNVADTTEMRAIVRTDRRAVSISLELSRSKWPIASLSPGAMETMSMYILPGGDIDGLLERFRRLQEMTRFRTGQAYPVTVIQETGLDGL
jgi:transposase